MKSGAEDRTGVAHSRKSIEFILTELEVSAMPTWMGPGPLVALDGPA